MQSLLSTWETSRKLLVPFFEKYTVEQLNKIPEGFSNNLIWNLGHVIVAQQSLIYKGSNTPMYISNELFDQYKPGTRPAAPVDQAHVDQLQFLLIDMIEKTKADLEQNRFGAYNQRMTGTGFYLGSLEDALHFNNFHEGLHYGVMLSLRKMV